MARSKSSQRWLREHHSDTFVRKSKAEAVRSRAVYKLEEIDQRDHLLASGMQVLELGAAPGGWTEYAVKRVGPRGSVLAVDILPMAPVDGAQILQGDFTEQVVLDEILRVLAGRAVDLVLSDMAPNFSGQSAVDQPRAIYLAELALDMCEELSPKPNAMLIKAFQGRGFDELLARMRGVFPKVASRKPAASRARSREVYLLGRH